MAGSQLRGHGGVDAPVWAMLDAVEEGCFAVAADGTLIAWNESFAVQLGYQDRVQSSLHLEDIVAPADRERVPTADDPEPGTTTLDLVTNTDERVTHTVDWERYVDEETGERLRVGVGRPTAVEREREWPAELERQRALLQELLNAIPDVVYAFDRTGDPVAEEFLLEEFAGYPSEELVELSPIELIAPEDRESMADAIGTVLAEGGVVRREATLLTKDGERVPYEFHTTRFERDGEVLGVIGSGRDVSERVERERALERQRDELAALADITELTLEITRELLETPSRRDVERIVCERLAGTDRYKFAWIGEQAVDGDRLVPRVSAGETAGSLDSITVDPGEDGAGMGPGCRAWRTGEVQVHELDEASVEPWQEAAKARGIEAVAGIPLQHGETVYGVLGVYATSRDAFSARKVDAFRILGETVGFVINAIKRRRLLFAEAVVDLEVAIGESSSVLARLSNQLEATVTLEGYLDLENRWVAYLEVESGAADAILDVLAADAAVEEARTIGTDAARTRAEVAIADAPLFDAAEAVGATVREASASTDGAQAVLEVPDDANVRETAELFTDALPGAALRAKQERDRQPGGPGRPDSLLAALTARQREALGVALRAGYFEWPRESTAGEVAQTLGISRPTLHAHLRKAEQSVFASLFDGRPPGE